jgi:hypothetical protein
MHGPSDLLEIARALLRQEKREEVDLEEQVAQLVREFAVVEPDRGVGDLVGLLDGMRNDRARGLLAVPGTVPPQTLGQLLEIEERPAKAGGAYVVVVAVAQGSGFGR